MFLSAILIALFSVEAYSSDHLEMFSKQKSLKKWKTFEM